MAVDVEPKVLSAEEQRAYGFTHKVNITYSDLTSKAGAADTTASITVLDGVAGLLVDKVAHNLVTAFDASDAAIDSLLCEFGDATDPNRLMGQTELAADGTEILFGATPNSIDTMPYAYPTAVDLVVKFTVSGGASPLIDELNAGEVEIYFNAVDLNKLEAR